MIYVYILVGGYVTAIATLVLLFLVVNVIERRRLEHENARVTAGGETESPPER